MEARNCADENNESRLYIGNLDLRITEASLIKIFSPFGKIISEDFLWHTRGHKRGEPRGYAFVQFSTKEEAKMAKEKMHGKLIGGRPLVVRLASEKYLMDESKSKSIGETSKSKSIGETSKSNHGSYSGPMNRDAKIAAIKNKLKAMDEESHNSKKQKFDDGMSSSGVFQSPASVKR